MNKKVRQLVEVAMMVALAVVFNYFEFFKMPQGGSISLVMLPLLILAFHLGVGYGVLGGIIFGLINLIYDGYPFHWGSFFLDYILAFGVLGLAGLFKKAIKGNLTQFILGVLFVGVIRYLLHSFSGVLFFADYAIDRNMTPVYYSFIFYNLPYLGISTLLCLVIGSMILPNLSRFLAKKQW